MGVKTVALPMAAGPDTGPAPAGRIAVAPSVDLHPGQVGPRPDPMAQRGRDG